jgi:hypothetical protein
MVKEAYQVIKEEEEEEEEEEGEVECDWYRDVWIQLIPSNMSTLAWSLFHKRLPTRENLISRGIPLLCVWGDCGNPEMEDHLFFNCPTLGLIWREIVKWLGVPIVLPEGGQNHLFLLKF